MVGGIWRDFLLLYKCLMCIVFDGMGSRFCWVGCQLGKLDVSGEFTVQGLH